MPVGRAVVKTDLRGKSVGSGPGPQDRKCFARANQAKSPGPGVASGWASLPLSSSRPGSTAPSQRALLSANS